MKGHIKLYRQLLDDSRSWLWKDPLLWSIYTQMLLKAAWGDMPHNSPALSRGEVAFSSRYAENRFRIGNQKIDQSTMTRKLNILVHHGLIELIDKDNGVYRLNYYDSLDGDSTSQKNTASPPASPTASNKKKNKEEDNTIADSGPGVPVEEYPREFEEIWKLGWQGGKKYSFKAYRKLVKKVPHDVLLKAASAYMATRPTHKFALYNWLNKEHYKDWINHAATSRLHVNTQEGDKPGKLGLSEEQKANRLRRLAEITKNTPAGPRRPGG